MEAAVELSLAIATATVLGCAGVLKLADAGPFRYRALGVAEVGVAVALLVDRSRLGGLILGCGLGLVFTSYSLVHVERPCRCFGERFRVAGTARLVRPVASSGRRDRGVGPYLPVGARRARRSLRAQWG